MLGVNQPQEEEGSSMVPVTAKMDEMRGNGVAGPAPGAQVPAVEADLGRICSEELVKVTNNIPPQVEQTVYARPPQYDPPVPQPRKVAQATSSNNNGAQSGAPCPYESSCSAAKECRSNAGRCGLMPTKLAESYYGYVETVEDAVMIVEACRFGRLMRVKRRLLDKERQGIRSGSVFVFVERESGIRRWTDGKVWSPSRICGEFLIYRELESRQANPNTGATRKTNPNTGVNWTEQVAKILAAKSRLATDEDKEKAVGSEGDGEQEKEESLEPEKKRPTIQVSAAVVDSAVASIRMALAAASNNGNAESGTNGSSPAPQPSTSNGGGKTMIFKRDGLIKKTISLTVADETYHLICYFKDSNLGSELLHLTPSRMAAFKNLDLCRNPVSYPIMMLQPGHGMNSGTTNPIPPHHLQQPQMGYPTAGRIINNGQYIAIPQAYMTQLMPPHQYASNFQQQARRLAPHQQQTIATGSVQLPPVMIKPNASNGSSRAGIANLLADPSSSSSSSSGCSAIDMENIEVMMTNNGNAVPGFTGCASGGCPSGCPSAGTCSKAATPAPAPVAAVAADNLEEEQLLFCHFLEAIRHEDSQ